MTTYEYKVVPAPTKGQKAKGVKSGEDRFAFAIQTLMNDLAAEGWEYQRAETLPSVERAGLTGSSTEWRNLLVFRRAQTANKISALQAEPQVAPAPAPVAVPEDPPQDPPLTEEGSDIERLRNTLYPREEPKLTDKSDA